MSPRNHARRASLAAIVAAALALPAPTRAEAVRVPILLQADLLFLIVGHDHNLRARAGAEVRTLILTKPSDDSARAAAQFRAAAAAKAAVAGLPHAVEMAPFTGAEILAETCRARRISIVYLTPGFTTLEARAIGDALDGENVLTASAVPGIVNKGAVLGFDLVSGRAKLLVDRKQAARQRVAFGAEVLSLMAVAP